MSFALNGGIFAVEEIDNATGNLDEVESAEVAATVADESAEIQNANTDIGIEVGRVEDAVQAGEELEDLGELAAESLEDGEGMSEETAEAVSIAVEGILNRLGAHREARLVPVAESFGATSSRRVSTKLVIEGIGDWLKKVWASIKAAAARLWDKIRNFMSGLFNSAKSLSKLLVSLKERAGKVPSDYEPKEDKLKNSSLAKSISWKEKADLKTFDLVLQSSIGLASVANKVSGHVESICNAAQGLAKAEINETNVKAFLDKKNPSIQQIEKDLQGALAAAAVESGATSQAVKKAKVKMTNKKNGDGIATAHFGPFPGGTMLTYVITKQTVMNVTSIDGSVAFEATSQKLATEAAALSITQIREVIEKSLKLANALSDFQAVQKSSERITKAQQGVADTVIREAEKILNKTGSSSETRQALGELKTSVADSLAFLNTFANNAPTMAFRAARAGADYASASLRNLQPKS